VGRPGMSGTRRPSVLPRVGLVAALALLLAVPALPVSSAAAPARPASATVDTAVGLSAVVYWNGVDISTAGSASSAFSIGSNSQVNVRYFWNSTLRGVTFDLNDARLAMTYFGFALSTRDVPPIASGNFTNGSFFMNWNVGAIEYVLAGTFLLTATLFSASGANVWSENFYVHLVPPDAVLAIIPILLIIIVAWELYAVARSGRQAALKKGPAAPPPSSAPGAAPPPPGNPPAGGNPPPSGGSPPASETPPTGGAP